MRLAAGALLIPVCPSQEGMFRQSLGHNRESVGLPLAEGDVSIYIQEHGVTKGSAPRMRG